MLSIASGPSKAINYMEQKKDFFIVKDESDQYKFYDKIAKSLEIYDKDSNQPANDNIEKSLNVNLDLNRLLGQLGSMLSMGNKYILKLSNAFIKSNNDKKFDKIVELSKEYKITLQYDKRILFEYVGNN